MVLGGWRMITFWFVGVVLIVDFIGWVIWIICIVEFNGRIFFGGWDLICGWVISGCIGKDG